MKKLNEIFKGAGVVDDNVELSRRLITPKVAEMMLENNSADNRHVNPRVVDKYARELKSGNWETSNPGVITFWKDGTMVDGQHRLRAIVKSGVSIPMTIAVVPNGVSYFDGQAKRNTQNYIEMKYKRKLDRQLISAIGMHLTYIAGVPAGRTTTPEETYEAYSQTPDAWDTALSLMRTGGGSHPIAKRGYAVFAARNALEAGVSEETLRSFFEALNSGYSSSLKDNQAITARNTLLEWANESNSKEKNMTRAGILEEYIRLYVSGATGRRKVKTPTWCYAKLMKREADAK